MSEMRRLLHGLSGIVTDLYATPAAAPSHTAAPAPAALPFQQLWKTADETIDWTDALASPIPTDGLTPPETWARYHALADRVLQGDTAAYLDALAYINPVADLMPYVASLDVQTASADVLHAYFAVRPDLLAQEPRQYLCGMAVRIARDLFATVPVTDVVITATQEERPLLTVSFERAEMNKVRFSFIDPVAFVTQCQGSFTKECPP